jgi:cell division septation protein DedD
VSTTSTANIIGQTFTVKLSDGDHTVHIDRECEFGGWYGTDQHGKSMRVTAARLGIKDDAKSSNRRQSVTVNTNSSTSEEDTVMPSSTRSTVSAADRRARRGVANSDNGSATGKTTAKPAAASGKTTTNTKSTAQTVKESNTVPAVKLTGKSNTKSTKPAARKPAAATTTTAKPAATKRKPAAKQTAKRTATVKTVDTVTVTLPALKETANKVQFGDKTANSLITGCYVHKDAVTALLDDSDAYMEMTFLPAANQPQNSVRWNEDGDDKAIGSLYVLKSGIAAAKFSAKDSDTLNVEAHMDEDENLVLTLTVA